MILVNFFSLTLETHDIAPGEALIQQKKLKITL